MQGFQKPLLNDSFIFDGMGALGRTQSERGLTHVEISLAGHQYAVISHRRICANHTECAGYRDTHLWVSGWSYMKSLQKT
ncbi:hypothetical protein EDB84DRAFT_1451223 [Lactarius hengduanensis]|nr:hypothetical protein EDB84DRAFT_1451223 [Lactarius hengduanensis]